MLDLVARHSFESVLILIGLLLFAAGLSSAANAEPEACSVDMCGLILADRLSASERAELKMALGKPDAIPNCTCYAGHGTRSALEAAAHSTNVEAVEDLIAAGADVNLRVGWGPPLVTVLDGGKDKRRRYRIARALLGAGARPDATSTNGFTPLRCATGRCHLRAVELLFRHGATMGNKRPNPVVEDALNSCIQDDALIDLLLSKVPQRKLHDLAYINWAAKEMSRYMGSDNEIAVDGFADHVLAISDRLPPGTSPSQWVGKAVCRAHTVKAIGLSSFFTQRKMREYGQSATQVWQGRARKHINAVVGDGHCEPIERTVVGAVPTGLVGLSSETRRASAAGAKHYKLVRIALKMLQRSKLKLPAVR